jgi:hypothetical protein
MHDEDELGETDGPSERAAAKQEKNPGVDHKGGFSPSSEASPTEWSKFVPERQDKTRLQFGVIEPATQETEFQRKAQERALARARNEERLNQKDDGGASDQSRCD